ncbi:MAG: hypothetical protein M5F18_07060 [Asgard group archaeon]|nr:hypothetical protein [Asgard group archaeon]
MVRYTDISGDKCVCVFETVILNIMSPDPDLATKKKIKTNTPEPIKLSFLCHCINVLINDSVSN